MPKPLVHHGAMFSYYSAKTRVYLSYKGIPFEEIYDGPDLTGRLHKVVHRAIVPIVELPSGEILQDTTVIIDVLEARHPDPPVFPDDPVLALITRLVEFAVDELWVTTAMNTRWNDPISKAFAISEFGRRIGGSLTSDPQEAMATGEGVARKMQSYLPNLGIDQPSGREACAHYFEMASRALDRAVSSSRYALGQRPSMIDFCLYTAYFAHQYRDPGAAHTFLKTECPELCYYLDNLSSVSCAPKHGALDLSEEFTRYLEVLGPPAAEFAAGASSRVAELDPPSGEPIDQPLEPVELDLLGRPLRRVTSVFGAWKAQRVRDAYLALADRERSGSNQLLREIGWLDFLESDPGVCLERVDYATHRVG